MKSFALPAALIGLAPALTLAAEPSANSSSPSTFSSAAQLPTVQVTDTAPGGLGLSRPTTSGSRTGIATRDLPASLDYVDEQTWQERGDSRMAEIIGRTVGMTPLSPTSYSSLSFSSRGFTGTNSVGIAEDGVRLGVASSTTPYPANSWGYERVEVLRGPASIVYGTGTVGATANVVRKQPSKETVREVLVGAGSHGTAKLGLGVGGALSDTLSYRLDAYGHHTNGEHDMSRASGGKLMSTLRWQPTAALRMELLADVSDEKPARYFGTPTVNGAIVPELLGRNFNTADSDIRIKDKRVRARAQYQVNDWLSVSNELYHFKADRYWRNIEAYSYNPSKQQVTLGDYLELAHDLAQTGNRLETTIQAGAHKVVAGWEVSRARFNFARNDYAGSTTIGVNEPSLGYWPNTSPMLPNYRTQATTHDFYAEDAWTLSDKWLLLAGIRRALTDFERNDLVGSASFDKRLNGTAWRLGLTHKLSAQTSLYGQLSQGHDPVTNVLTLNLGNSPFKLTTARQIELGLKQQFAQGQGEWTAAAYRIEKKDIITRDPNNALLSVQGGKQSSQGLELSAVMRLSPQWRVEGNYAFVDAQYDKLIEAGGVDRSGKRPTNVARNTANLWAHYTTHSSLGLWQASLGARAVGSRFADNANTARSGGYTVWDAALSWRPQPHSTYRLTLRNLNDKLYTYSAVSNARASQAYPGEGRRVDLTAEFTF
ncbi:MULTISPECIES: TonB-dependent receptor [Comamonas]|uniref:TonB-denpendent receptor n=1 Tax=Comamonas testosteroni TaxID=285 RepID=A0A096FIN1_COMTE|nr:MULTISPECIES: TonB-dependent receptor [Comamonas]KGH29548.1 TonB-denpendent receptor [Comamonas testosteroni]MPT09798.1 TonB-dependent receptor [Comamonas sp.]